MMDGPDLSPNTALGLAPPDHIDRDEGRGSSLEENWGVLTVERGLDSGQTKQQIDGLHCCCSVTMSCPTLATTWTAAHQAPLFFTVSQSLLKLMSIESVVPSNHLTLFHPLLLLPSVFVSIFSSVSSLYIRWPNYWSFSFSISPSNEYSGLISFRINWFDLLAVQGTLKSLIKKKKNLLQHHSLKASVLWYSAFLMVQLSHLYITTEKCIALTTWTFLGPCLCFLICYLGLS